MMAEYSSGNTIIEMGNIGGVLSFSLLNDQSIKFENPILVNPPICLHALYLPGF